MNMKHLHVHHKYPLIAATNKNRNKLLHVNRIGCLIQEDDMNISIPHLEKGPCKPKISPGSPDLSQSPYNFLRRPAYEIMALITRTQFSEKTLLIMSEEKATSSKLSLHDKNDLYMSFS